MKYLLPKLAICFCSGIFLGHQAKPLFAVFYFPALILFASILLLFRKKLSFEILLFCLVFFLGASWMANYRILPKCHIYNFTTAKSQPLKIKGFIVSEPATKDDRTTFIFRTEEIRFLNLKNNCCGNILVIIKGKRELFYGQPLIIYGKLYKPFGRSGQGKKSYRDYLYSRGIFSVLYARSPSGITVLSGNKGLAVKRLALWCKAKIEAIIYKKVSFISAGIMDAMILGEKRNILSSIYKSMIKTGTVHILVVSGSNVGVIFFIIILFLKLIRIPRKARLFFSAFLLVIYCFITGASTPVVRATVMATTFIFAYLFKREPDIYNSCALAMLFILLINPDQLFDVGFQLSFASVISIVYFYPKIRALLRLEALKYGFLRFFAEGLAVSFSAWLGTAGFILYYFKMFSPVTVLANMIIVPLASLITLCGLSLIFIQLFCPFLANFFAQTSEIMAVSLVKINQALACLPHAYFYF